MTIVRRSNRRRLTVLGIALVLGICATGWWTPLASAEVNVNIGVFAPPPPLVVAGPPAMAVAPGPAYVYYAPEVSAGLLFYQGYWWRPHEGHWFRAHSYKGPWRYIDNDHTPTPILRLPADYRKVPPGHYRVTHGQMKKQWKNWEKKRHWDRMSHGHHAVAGPYRAEHHRAPDAHHGRGR